MLQNQSIINYSYLFYPSENDEDTSVLHKLEM